ncbi:MAG: glycoside hydrolase family 5 protein [Planctomycetes bacterium]|nr:glycoside hydrolase family 5 protein [Planctomycetota bacterium]
MFEIQRGTNISHWLSQSTRRGEETLRWFTEKDVERIAALGFDHIRLPADEEQLWDEAGQKENEAFQLLHDAIGWCQKKNLRVIVDLHILRSHHFNAKEKPLWTDPKAQEQFFALWRALSAELKKYPVALVAYELMNEPVADNAADWNKLVETLVRQIRKDEPHRKIVIGSNKWQSTGTFDQLRIPAGDRDIILSFHFYTPMLITHYKAGWTEVGKYRGPVSYPGQLVAPEEVTQLDPEIARIVKGNNGVYDRERLESLLAKPLALAKQLDLPLYCGEWGALPTTPREVRMQWYRDMRANLEKHGIAWANWDYKGGFGIVGRSGQPDQEFVKVLLGR